MYVTYVDKQIVRLFRSLMLFPVYRCIFFPLTFHFLLKSLSEIFAFLFLIYFWYNNTQSFCYRDIFKLRYLENLLKTLKFVEFIESRMKFLSPFLNSFKKTYQRYLYEFFIFWSLLISISSLIFKAFSIISTNTLKLENCLNITLIKQHQSLKFWRMSQFLF